MEKDHTASGSKNYRPFIVQALSILSHISLSTMEIISTPVLVSLNWKQIRPIKLSKY
jgi:hypothetical protein